MGINIIKEEIKIIIETLAEQYSVINQNNGRIPQIEIDIVMANVRRLYERLCDLNKLNSLEFKAVLDEISEIIPEMKEEISENREEIPSVDAANINETFEQEKAKIEEIEEELVEEKIEAIPEEIVPEIIAEVIETKEPEVVVAEEIIEEMVPATEVKSEVKPDLEKTLRIEPPVEVNPTESAPAIVEEIIAPPPPPKPPKPGKADDIDLFSLAEKEIVADKFKESQKSMHDKLSHEKPDKTLADKISKASISNLKSAIGINDKFLFINELFKGDIQEYNKTIDKLNSFTKLEDITGLLEELTEKFNWNEKPEAYQKLEDLIIRKFL